MFSWELGSATTRVNKQSVEPYLRLFLNLRFW